MKVKRKLLCGNAKLVFGITHTTGKDPGKATYFLGYPTRESL